MNTPDIRNIAAFRDEGWTSRDLRSAVADGTLERVRRGSYTPPAARDAVDDHILQALAAWQYRSDDHVVSHTSAAVIHGLPVRAAALGEIHLTRWSAVHGHLKAGVRLHRARVPDADTEVRHGVRITSLERTVADLARWEPYEWGVAAADAALRIQADPDRLAELAEETGRRKGNGRLRSVLAFADARSGSPAESMSRVGIARFNLPKPVLQFEVLRPDGGGWVATSDFGWPDHGVVGETDGKAKYADDNPERTPADVIMAEKERDALIVECGYTPTHRGWKTATNHLKLGRHLRAVFASRGYQV